MGTVNCYLFKDPEPTLVDCGLNNDDTWQALRSSLQKESLQIKDISKIIITHAHVDHMGMASRIVEESGAKVWLSEYAYEWGTGVTVEWSKRKELIASLLNSLINPDGEIANYLKSAQSFFNMMETYWQAIPEESIVKFNSADGIDFGNVHWETIYAPGHSSTQTCFYHRDSGKILSADMLLKLAPTPVIEYDPLDSSKRMKGLPLLIESYKTFRDLDISTAYPGHYLPFENHKDTITAQLNRINGRIDECHTHIKNGVDRFDDIFNLVYPKRLMLPAISMLIGYLDTLEEDGLITKETHNGCFKFSAK